MLAAAQSPPMTRTPSQAGDGAAPRALAKEASHRALVLAHREGAGQAEPQRDRGRVDEEKRRPHLGAPARRRPRRDHGGERVLRGDRGGIRESRHDAGHHRLVGQRPRAQGAHERLRRRGGRHEQGGLLGMPAQHCAGGPADGRCLLAGPARCERRGPRPHTERAPTGHLRPSRLPTRSVRVRHRRPWPVSSRDGAVASFPGGDPCDPTGPGRRGRHRHPDAG